MKRWEVKVKEFEIMPSDGFNPFGEDQVTDWLNEKGLMPQEIAITWQGEILKIFYREWRQTDGKED